MSHNQHYIAEVLPIVFSIEDMCGITLDTFGGNQVKAIKTFIQDYSPRDSNGRRYKLMCMEHGMKKQIHPHGNISDYLPKAP